MGRTAWLRSVNLILLVCKDHWKHKYGQDGMAKVSDLIVLVCKGHWRHKHEKNGMAKVSDLIFLICKGHGRQKYEKDGMAKVSDLILLVCKGHGRQKYEKDGLAKVNEPYTSQGQMPGCPFRKIYLKNSIFKEKIIKLSSLTHYNLCNVMLLLIFEKK